MTTRLDLALQKYPEHADAIRLLGVRDPSGNLRYINWGAKMLTSGQALAPEIADVIELFHQFGQQRFASPPGHSRRRYQVRPDLYSYRPQDFAGLRDTLVKLKRAKDRKQKKRERLYRIEGAVEADVIYDSPDLIVRHIKNKEASVHYGLGTRWCISMLREGYFEDYDSQNATFFFFERKVPGGGRIDEFDKVAIMMPRSGSEMMVEAFTSADRRVDMIQLAKMYGARVFDIFREIYERTERYPGSAMSRVYAGRASREQLETVFASIPKSPMSYYEIDALLEAICCNPEAPLTLLEEIVKRAPSLSTAAWRRSLRGQRRTRRVLKHSTVELERTLMAALFIHHTVRDELRAKIEKELRRRRISTGNIHSTKINGRVGVSYKNPSGGRMVRYARRLRRRGRETPSELRVLAERYERRAVSLRKRIAKLAEKKKGKKR
jgi:hypothetical protein